MKTIGYIVLLVAIVGLAFIVVPKTNSNAEPVQESLTQLDENKGVQFQKIDFNQALKKAKNENKFIFMNVYAVWCRPCMILKNTTFQSDKVAEMLNKNFINLDIDAEKGEGIELSKKYNVEAHPLMLIIDSEGNVVKSILGYRKDNQLINEIKDLVMK